MKTAGEIGNRPDPAGSGFGTGFSGLPPPRRPVCIGWDASILLLFAGLAVIIGWNGIEYLSGLTNLTKEDELFGWEVRLFALIGLLLLSCIAAMSGRLIYQWKAVPAWGSAVRCGIILLMWVGGIGAYTHQVSGIYKLAQRFEVRMRRDADMKAIRAWASGLVVPPTSGCIPDVPENLWPKCVTALSPKDVLFLDDVHAVRLLYGGGFIGDYGLVVGPADMELPHTDKLYLIIPLEAGAYLYFSRG